MFFRDLESLFQYVLEKNRVLVYSDLGRSPDVVVQYLSLHHSRLKIFFASLHYPIAIPNHVQQFRQISFRESVTAKCDLLVLLEPSNHAILQKAYAGAGSVVVITSHGILELPKNDPIDVAIYFQSTEDRVDKIKRLTARWEGSEETDNVQIAKRHIAHPSVLTIGPSSYCDVVLGTGKVNPPPGNEGDYFVVVDLTNLTRPLSIFLGYLDAFDYMTENLDSVERWSVCFPPGGTQKYENFVQECIDQLHCSPRFRPYLKELLPLLPFYKSGAIEVSYEDVPVSRIVRHEYVAPDSLEEAFKSAMVHDTLQLVGGVLSIVK